MDKKWPSYGQKSMPIYGIIDILRAILAHNTAKYQYFSMRPDLFDKFHSYISNCVFSKMLRLLHFSYFSIILYVAATQLNSLFKSEAGFLIWASKIFGQIFQKKFGQKFLEAQIKNPASFLNREFSYEKLRFECFFGKKLYFWRENGRGRQRVWGLMIRPKSWPTKSNKVLFKSNEVLFICTTQSIYIR